MLERAKYQFGVGASSKKLVKGIGHKLLGCCTKDDMFAQSLCASNYVDKEIIVIFVFF